MCTSSLSACQPKLVWRLLQSKARCSFIHFYPSSATNVCQSLTETRCSSDKLIKDPGQMGSLCFWLLFHCGLQYSSPSGKAQQASVYNLACCCFPYLCASIAPSSFVCLYLLIGIISLRGAYSCVVYTLIDFNLPPRQPQTGSKQQIAAVFSGF